MTDIGTVYFRPSPPLRGLMMTTARWRGSRTNANTSRQISAFRELDALFGGLFALQKRNGKFPAKSRGGTSASLTSVINPSLGSRCCRAHLARQDSRNLGPQQNPNGNSLVFCPFNE